MTYTMNYELTLDHIYRRSIHLFPSKRLTNMQTGSNATITYETFAERVAKLSGFLREQGIGKGNRVATFALNSTQHLELYWAAPLTGAIVHTINVRSPLDDISYIMSHAEDDILFIDSGLWNAVRSIISKVASLKRVVVIGHSPGTPLEGGALDYEVCINSAAPASPVEGLRETDACGMCYTSGTTGRPKGVIYSHRAIFLQSLALANVDTFGVSEHDVMLNVVPMFHANSWCLPYVGIMNGADQVFPGTHSRPSQLARVIEDQRVTLLAAVPTIWRGLYEAALSDGANLSSIRCGIVGGAAAPPSLLRDYENRFGIRLTQAWGMTELGPLGTVSRLKTHLQRLPNEEQIHYLAKQGLPSVGIDIRVVDDDGAEISPDANTQGEIQARGPWVAASYYRPEDGQSPLTDDGWLKTGDIATIDREGYIEITDREKDLIKSGGEWISSIKLENLIMSHDKVLEAAVIGVPDEIWQERPIAYIVAKDKEKVPTLESIRELLAPLVPRWWLPNKILVVDSIPKTATGKFDKRRLRGRGYA